MHMFVATNCSNCAKNIRCHCISFRYLGDQVPRFSAPSRGSTWNFCRRLLFIPVYMFVWWILFSCLFYFPKK